MKTELSGNALQTGGIRKHWLFDFVGREKVLKKELIENDGVTKIT